MKKYIYSALLLLFVTFLPGQTFAQWSQDFQNQMEIPGIVDLESSESHFYALSESEGLVVFRAHSDSLQYLYASTGMQRRGNTLEADIRFAYLYGEGRRLTVIEPTSVLGVYSSTVLPEPPKATKRISNNLYISLGEGGLAKISLETPETVDSDPDYIDTDRFEGRSILDLASDNHRLLYVLSDNRHIDIFQHDSDIDSIVHEEQVQLDRDISKIFLTNDELIGTDDDGSIYLIDSDGQSRQQATVDEPVQKLQVWDDFIAVRTETGQLWVGIFGDDLTLWKDNEEAGNYFTVTEGNFWVSEFNTLSPVHYTERLDSDEIADADAEEGLKLKPISNVTLPFPRPLIIPIEFEESAYEPDQISISYRGTVDNARIRGNTLYWQPQAAQTGRQQFTITASTVDGRADTTSFAVDLRPFNAPPRFSPSRPISIPAEEEFELEIEAFDPDGFNTDLVRYVGVDLPDGASLNEQTGVFEWTPNIRQVGEHSFQVIATDQFGAAASQDYDIRVVEMDDDFDEEELQGVEN